MNLGETIKSCRLARGLKQKELAERTGISVSHICLMENGNRQPTRSSLKLITKALDIPLSVLVFLAAQKSHEIKDLDSDTTKKLSDTIMNLIHVGSAR